MTLRAEGLVAGHARKQSRQFALKSVKQPTGGTGVSLYRTGDLLRIRLSSDTAGNTPSVWIRVERSDDQRRIVYGMIDSGSVGLGKALSPGAKLAVGYHLVRENANVVNFGRTYSTHSFRK
jgi:hypothetical protein